VVVVPFVGQGVELAMRAAVAPGVLAARLWPGGDRPAAVPAPTSLSTLKSVLDEVFLLAEVVSAERISVWDGERRRAELVDALAFFERQGWVDRPSGYHRTPPPPHDAVVERTSGWGWEFEHLRFESGWMPHPGEPGTERWLGRAANRTAHAWILRHPGPPRPWIVCVPGYRMGHPLVDFTGFQASWLHHRRGLNVAIPVLPLHGPRGIGWRSGDGFLTGDYLDTLHLQAQAVWDVRRVIAWVREQGAAAIGVYGVSLGGCTAALTAAFEPDLACVIAGVPATCWMGIAQGNLPRFLLDMAESAGLAWRALPRLLRVVSPLAVAPRVDPERRFLFAGTGDRLVSPRGVVDLWRHWGRPRLVWYEGSHVTFSWEPQVRALLREALATSGLARAS
jgi:hypothetical protein